MNIYKKLFCDKNGKLALFQFPNIPLVIWMLTTGVSWLYTARLAIIAGHVAFVAIVVWAGLEIFTGYSIFRRILGLVVLIFSLAAKL